MEFSEAALTAKLASLAPTQASIESVSGWCQFFRDAAPRVVATWTTAFDAAGSDGDKLTLLYLASDVLQNSRRKGTEYLTAFGPVLPPRVAAVAASTADAKAAASAARLIAIFRERQVFGSGTDALFSKRPATGAVPLPRRKRGARSDLTAAQTALVDAANAASHASALESALEGVLAGGDTPTPADESALDALVAALDAEAAARSTAADVLAGLADAERAAVERVRARRAVADGRRRAAKQEELYSPGGSPVA